MSLQQLMTNKVLEFAASVFKGAVLLSCLVVALPHNLHSIRTMLTWWKKHSYIPQCFAYNCCFFLRENFIYKTLVFTTECVLDFDLRQECLW